MDSTIITSPLGEPQPNGLLDIPLDIKLYPASDEVCAQEIDLVLSVLDDIVREMQRLGAELEADAGVTQSNQILSILSCAC